MHNTTRQSYYDEFYSFKFFTNSMTTIISSLIVAMAKTGVDAAKDG